MEKNRTKKETRLLIQDNITKTDTRLLIRDNIIVSLLFLLLLLQDIVFYLKSRYTRLSNILMQFD